MQSAGIFSSGVLALLAMQLPAQGNWVPRSSQTVPPGEIGAMAYDSGRKRVVLAIRPPGGTVRVEIWEWDGLDWARAATSAAGSYWFDYGTAAYDSKRRKTVIRGGYGGETWTWDGSQLTLEGVSPRPGGYYGSRMVFDEAHGSILLFGGRVDLYTSYPPVHSAETWSWTGLGWQKLSPLVSPAKRASHAMVYDNRRQRVVMFGGSTEIYTTPSPRPPAVYYADTWEWDGTGWYEVTPATGPAARHGHAMVFDPTSGLTFMFGGLGKDGMPLRDMWSWDGRKWSQLTTRDAPAGRWEAAVTFDAARNRAVLWGGYNVPFTIFLGGGASALRDTWEYTPGKPGSFLPYGIGCAGSRGTPALSAHFGSLPIAGAPFRVQLNNLPLVGPAWMFVGASKTDYGSLKLPFDLTVAGAPGCWLLASGDLLFPVTNVLGSGLFSVDIPPDLAGATVYLQAIVGDLPANQLGMTTSHGGEAKIGG